MYHKKNKKYQIWNKINGKKEVEEITWNKKQNAEENASLLMLKLTMTNDNCFRKAFAKDLFMQGSTLSLSPICYRTRFFNFLHWLWRSLRAMVSTISNQAHGHFAGESREICEGNRMSGSYRAILGWQAIISRWGIAFRETIIVMDVIIRVPWTRSCSSRPKFSGSILRRNTDPQVGVKRWKTWRRSVNIPLEYFR